MKVLTALVLAALAFFVASMSTPTVMAQGPTTPEMLVNALNAKNVQVTVQGVDTRFYFTPTAPKYCIVEARIPMPPHGLTETMGQVTAKFLGVTWETLNAVANEPQIITTEGWIWLKMYFPPEFCNPPSGGAKAQNPVPEPNLNVKPAMDSSNMVLIALLGLVVVVGFLFFPRFAGAFVRI